MTRRVPPESTPVLDSFEAFEQLLKLQETRAAFECPISWEEVIALDPEYVGVPKFSMPNGYAASPPTQSPTPKPRFALTFMIKPAFHLRLVSSYPHFYKTWNFAEGLRLQYTRQVLVA